MSNSIQQTLHELFIKISFKKSSEIIQDPSHHNINATSNESMLINTIVVQNISLLLSGFMPKRVKMQERANTQPAAPARHPILLTQVVITCEVYL